MLVRRYYTRPRSVDDVAPIDQSDAVGYIRQCYNLKEKPECVGVGGEGGLWKDAGNLKG